MKDLHILIPRHYDFTSSHQSSMWLESILPELSTFFSVKITWFYYSPKKIKTPILKDNENIIQIQDYKNAVEVIQKIKPDLIFDSEFPTLIDLSFLAASRNYSLYIRKFSNHKMFKVPLKLHSTLSRLNTNIPIDDKKKKSVKRWNFYFYKYSFFLKTLFSSNLSFFEKLNYLMISIKWNLITESPFINSKIQTDMELLNSITMKEILIKKGYDDSKLIVTGNPMFDKFFNKRNEVKHSLGGKIKILFAPFQHYGEDHKDFQKKITLDIVKLILTEKENFSLKIKLHPSYHDFNYFKKLISSVDNSIQIFQEGSIEKYLDESDIFISNGQVASSAIYGLIQKKPVIFCDFYNLYSYEEFNHIIFDCKNKNLFLKLLKESYKLNKNNSKFIENFLEKNYFKTDGMSSKRVTKAIQSIMEKN